MHDHGAGGDPVTITLHAAKAWLRDHLEDGVKCPCCTQRAQIYRRKISDTMAGKLIGAYRLHRLDYFHMPTLVADLGIRGRDESHLAYWKLLDEALLNGWQGQPRTLARSRPSAVLRGRWTGTTRSASDAAETPLRAGCSPIDTPTFRISAQNPSTCSPAGTRFDYSDLLD